MKPAQYWRQNKEWSKWLGRKGKVVASTMVRVAAPDRSLFTPYSYVIVEFGKERHEFMGASNDELVIGDVVECVLRKIGTSEKHELIQYGIKVAKVSS